MPLLADYQLFLFDFDGLLVNTEQIHWKAYQKLCANHGHTYPLTFSEYCAACHTDSEGPRRSVYGTCPQLKVDFPDWSVLYEEKCRIYSDLVESGSVELMPGAERLLTCLADLDIPRAVVTHSRAHHLALCRAQLPILDTIPHWITREDYSQPKPSPECYLKAISLLASPGDRIVGFEDTPRGLAALRGTPAQAVFVATPDYPLLAGTLTPDTLHLTSLDEVV